MPLTPKGNKILRAMEAHYKKAGGGNKKAKAVFYASANKGTITGVHEAHANHGKK